ncbi:type IV pilin-like G/H family protein [Aliterella atlantica]|uniref:General secretion pathway protein GspH n=1 Tax=Aliterella atlantica CENA595 TaxID=1618023 RepID=A0A0D8ZWA2_9CYAN|nr:type IV pilin-like G/H family protein [Aliterella atlantica]KJH71516.1 hypothetical protein UH38_11995 [Aliterella atlantica CENA595]
MKTELKVKFLQHLNQKKQDRGFTLIELLVVIIIIGILSAIALPSFLSQVAKARQSEGKANVGSLNRAQQTYYFEKETFTNDINSLGIGISTTNNYSYSAAAITSITDDVANKARSLNVDLKGYVGGVFKNTVAGTTKVILCEANSTGQSDPGVPDSSTYCSSTLSRL